MDTSLLPEMKRYGAFDISACFNCGNCTAVCPLSEGSVAFPRRVIRYAQLGQRPELAASREIWLCYYCAQCSDTCPRASRAGSSSWRRHGASPQQASTPPRLSRRLNRSASSAVGHRRRALRGASCNHARVVSRASRGRQYHRKLLEFVPYEAIHWLGIGVGDPGRFFTTMTLANMLWMISRRRLPALSRSTADGPHLPARGRPAARCVSTLAEIVSQSRYRDCDSGRSSLRALTATPLVHPLRDHGRHGRSGGGHDPRPSVQDARFVRTHLLTDPAPGHHRRALPRLRGHASSSCNACADPTSTTPAERRFRLAAHRVPLDHRGERLRLGACRVRALIGRSWIAVVFLAHVALAMELILLLPFTQARATSSTVPSPSGSMSSAVSV